MDLSVCNSNKVLLNSVASSVLETVGRQNPCLQEEDLLAERRDKRPLIMQRRKWNVCVRTVMNVQKESLLWLDRSQAGCVEEVAFEVVLKRWIRFKHVETSKAE